jgi:ABC-type dipeptide/oligopeptide/nickel transport system permease subunit
MRLTEIVQSLPTVLLAIALAEVLPKDVDHLPRVLQFLWLRFAMLLPHELAQLKLFDLLLAIGLVTWTGIARAVRGEVMSLKQREYVEAARAVGCSHSRIVMRHLLPNVAPTIIVLATLSVANNILLEAGLSYLGLGVEPATPSWGRTIADGQPFMLSAPWIVVVPGVAIVLAVAGFNFVGQALHETIELPR